MKQSVGQIRLAEKKGIKGKKPSSEGPVRAQKALTILLVDDHKNTLKIMGMVVKGLGHNPKTARNGTEALEIYKEGGIDLVITDFEMPEMNGFKLLEALKRHDPKARVIMATAYVKILDEESIVEAGAIAVMAKPLDRNYIENLIDDVRRDIQNQ